MDSGEKERAVVNDFKNIVKHTSRRKSSVPYYKKRHSPTRIAPKSSDGSLVISSSDHESSSQHSVNPSSLHGSSQEDQADMQRSGSVVRMLFLQ